MQIKPGAGVYGNTTQEEYQGLQIKQNISYSLR
jgi:hypothetical protein